MFTEQEIAIIQAKVKLDSVTEKLNVAIKTRDDALANEDVKAQLAKVEIVNTSKNNIDNLTMQKGQAEEDYKTLLIKEK